MFLYLFFQFQTTSKIFFDSKSILLNCWDFKGQKGLFLDIFMHFRSFCMHFQCWTNKTGGKLGLFLSPALKTGKNSSQGLIILGKRDSSTLTWSVVFTTLVWRGGQEQLKIAGQASEEDLVRVGANIKESLDVKFRWENCRRSTQRSWKKIVFSRCRRMETILVVKEETLRR